MSRGQSQQLLGLSIFAHNVLNNQIGIRNSKYLVISNVIGHIIWYGILEFMTLDILRHSMLLLHFHTAAWEALECPWGGEGQGILCRHMHILIHDEYMTDKYMTSVRALLKINVKNLSV